MVSSITPAHAAKAKPPSSRRRSLKSLFHIPTSLSSQDASAGGDVPAPSSIANSTASSATFTTSTAHSPTPPDIILTIAALLSSADVLSFSMTSSALRALLAPVLYSTVILRSSSKCRRTLLMLSDRPDLCGHIRKLLVRPNYYLSWPKRDKFVDEEWVATIIADIAPNLVLLNAFDWDGLEVPSDRLWEALRVSCPLLRNISTNLGMRLVDTRSKLFEFNDLTTFSIVVRHNLGAGGDGDLDLFPPLQHLPEAFWEMILKRCPELTELTICSFSPYTCTFDITPLLTTSSSSSLSSGDGNQFPRLASLTLGSFGYQSNFSLGPPYDPSFGDFLSQHPSLTYLRLLWNFRRWVSPDVVPMSLAPRSLPKLETFVGIYQQLAELPIEHRSMIEAVDLTCEPVYEMRVDKVCEVLSTMPGLKCLDIWVHVVSEGEGGEGRDNSMFFGRLINACCKGLEELHFMCTTPFAKKSLDQLLAHLKEMPNLKRFSLTKGHRYRGDESMIATAERVARTCRQVKTVSVRWARERCPNHLKQEGLYEVEDWRGEGRKTGVVLVVHERGIPMIGRPFERRYRRRVVF